MKAPEPSGETPMDDVDRKILNRIQSDFPISSRPYQTIAEELHLSEEEVLTRLKRLKENGIIRRIGANFVPEKLGFVSTLCAASVPDKEIETFTQVVNQYPGVTHNYQRDNEFNIWFTFIAQSAAEIEKNLEDISKKTGISNILNLPASRVYKIKAQFDV
jgi:DNA-binding Lrp family transcriptional regulator